MKPTRSRLRLSAVVAVAVILAGTAVAIAAQSNQPDTDEVSAEVVYSEVQARTRQCDGVDGPYAEQLVRASGTSTGDPRLSGLFRIRIHVLVNVANGVGIEDGTFKVLDPSTRRVKAEGQLKDAGTAEISQGILFGNVIDEGTGPGEETQGAGQIIANFRTTFGADIRTQIGGTTNDARIPAVIFSGQCSGPFESAGTGSAAAGLSGWSRFSKH